MTAYSCPRCGCAEAKDGGRLNHIFVWIRCRDCGWDYRIAAPEEDDDE